MRQHFKHIPPYLRHLIWATSRKYVHVPSCYVQLVIKLISNYQCKVLFLVLNYDDMLEGALKRAYPALFKFDDLTDYTRPERPAQVIKLHGSTNWFVQMPKLGSWEESVEKFDVLTKPEKEAITLNNGVTENFRRDFDEAYFLFPVITTPLAGKELTDAVCPDSHLEVAREFLSDCQKFLIIGTSGLDQDLMELLDSSINPACKNVVHSVNYGDGGIKSLLKFKEGVKAFNNRDSVHQVFDQGFRKYIAGTSLANLAAVDSFS